MGTVKELIRIASSQIGVFENPPNSNRVLYNTWYYGKEVSGSRYPWCLVFCLWCYHKADVPISLHTASCTRMMEWAKSRGLWIDGNFKPGDLLMFDFKGQRRSPQHCGILVAQNEIFHTIEGNTSIGDNTNGGEVMERVRYRQNIVGAVRPQFDEEDLEMTKSEFIKSLTDKEAYQLLEKALRHADSLGQSDWSKEEGFWDEALEKGVVNTRTPQGLPTREQLVAILGRMGLL